MAILSHTVRIYDQFSLTYYLLYTILFCIRMAKRHLVLLQLLFLFSVNCSKTQMEQQTCSVFVVVVSDTKFHSLPRRSGMFIYTCTYHYISKIKILVLLTDSQRRGSLMTGALNSGPSGLGSSAGRSHCVVFLAKTFYSHSASFQNYWICLCHRVHGRLYS